MLFANRSELNNAISFLMKKYNEEANNPTSIERIRNLVAEVQDLAVDMYDNDSRLFIKAYTFGSRSTGLASENSDVDIFLQIGGFERLVWRVIEKNAMVIR